MSRKSELIASTQIWGFDPVKLINQLEFPNDREEHLLKRSHAARLRMLNARKEIMHSQQQSTLPALDQPNPGSKKRIAQVSENVPQTLPSASDIEARALKRQLLRLTAAVAIQACFRGWNTRRKYLIVRNPDLSIHSVRASEALVDTLPPLDNERLLRRYRRFCKIHERVYQLVPEFPHFAASIIQAHWRMHCVRRSWIQYKLLNKEQKGGKQGLEAKARINRHATLIQTKNSLRDNQIKNSGFRQSIWDRAASKIQKAWRCYHGKHIYTFYKNILALNNGGNPSRLLKYINPQEVQLMDGATGLHIKFRLGGVQFPPTIYYKIFVHHSLVDMNAFSPRNYTTDCKQPLPKNIFNRSNDLCPKPIDNGALKKSLGWYERMENNPWRPISDKIWDLRNDPDFNPNIPSRKAIPFHHSVIVRKEEAARLRKQKRLDWMQKMYREGKALAELKHKTELPPLAPFDSISAAEASIAQLELELEGDLLIKWTQALNYDVYVDDWMRLATSGSVKGMISKNTHSTDGSQHRDVHLKVRRINDQAQEQIEESIPERAQTAESLVSLSELLYGREALA